MRSFIAVVLLFLAVAFCSRSGSNTSTSKSTPVVETRQQRIERAFSAWDGSHVELTKAIKKNLRDPGSYEHIETKFKDNGESITVITSYRAKNGFGGYTPGVVIATAAIDGRIVEIVSQ